MSDHNIQIDMDRIAKDIQEMRNLLDHIEILFQKALLIEEKNIRKDQVGDSGNW